MITFEVIGRPAPKGSVRAVRAGKTGRAVIIPDNKPATTSWRTAVAEAASATAVQLGCEPVFRGRALRVLIVFRLQRPSGHTGARGLKPSAPPFPAVKPDLDKLVRGTLDPMIGLIYDEDSRVVIIESRKKYRGQGELEGATITVEPLTVER